MRSTSFQSVSFPREWSTRGQPGAGANHCSRQRSNGGSPAGPAQLRELGGAIGAAHSRGSPGRRGWTAERRRHSLSPRPFAHLQRARRGRGLLWPAPERSQRSAFAAPPRLLFHHRLLSLLYRELMRFQLWAEQTKSLRDAWSSRLLALLGLDTYEQPLAVAIAPRDILRLA